MSGAWNQWGGEWNGWGAPARDFTKSGYLLAATRWRFFREVGIQFAAQDGLGVGDVEPSPVLAGADVIGAGKVIGDGNDDRRGLRFTGGERAGNG